MHKWLNGWRQLKFVEKHQVALAIAGVCVSLSLGACSIVLTIYQMRAGAREARRAWLEESNRIAQRDVTEARRVFMPQRD